MIIHRHLPLTYVLPSSPTKCGSPLTNDSSLFSPFPHTFPNLPCPLIPPNSHPNQSIKQPSPPHHPALCPKSPSPNLLAITASRTWPINGRPSIHDLTPQETRAQSHHLHTQILHRVLAILILVARASGGRWIGRSGRSSSVVPGIGNLPRG